MEKKELLKMNLQHFAEPTPEPPKDEPKPPTPEPPKDQPGEKPGSGRNEPQPSLEEQLQQMRIENIVIEDTYTVQNEGDIVQAKATQNRVGTGKRSITQPLVTLKSWRRRKLIRKPRKTLNLQNFVKRVLFQSMKRIS